MTVAPPEIPALAGIPNASPKPAAATGLLAEADLFPGLLDAIELDLAKEDSAPRDLPLNEPGADKLDKPEPGRVAKSDLTESGDPLPLPGNSVPTQPLDNRLPIERDIPRELGRAIPTKPREIGAVDKPLPAQGDIEVGHIEVSLRPVLNDRNDQTADAKPLPAQGDIEVGHIEVSLRRVLNDRIDQIADAKPLPAQGDIEVGHIEVSLRRVLNDRIDQIAVAKPPTAFVQTSRVLADPALVETRPDTTAAIRRSATADVTPDAISPAKELRTAAETIADEKDAKTPDRREDVRVDRPSIAGRAGRTVSERPEPRAFVEAEGLPEKADFRPRADTEVAQQSLSETGEQKRQPVGSQSAARPEVTAFNEPSEMKPVSYVRSVPDASPRIAARDERRTAARDQSVKPEIPEIPAPREKAMPKEVRQERAEIGDTKTAVALDRTPARRAKTPERLARTPERLARTPERLANAADPAPKLDKSFVQPIRPDVTSSPTTAVPSPSVLASASSAPVQGAEILATQQPAPAQPSTPSNPVPTPVEARVDARANAQLDSVIDHLVEARESGRAAKPELTLRHQEFGAINLRLEATGADLRASLSARDPGFVPAVQAALADRAIAASSESAPGQSQRGQDQTGSSQNWSGGHSNSQSDRSYGSSTGSGHASSQPYPEQTGQRDEEAGGRSSALAADRDSRDEHNSGLFA